MTILFRRLLLTVLLALAFVAPASADEAALRTIIAKFATAKAKWDYDYRQKWEIDNRPARDLPDGAWKKIEHVARRVYRILKLRGFARLDLRLTPEGQVFVLEANPNPSLALYDDFAASAAEAGVTHEELMAKILALA